ncbi:hypothetical protein [Glaciimonas soli]|uniref:Uncharacterized protein n=1 Tax=Glaciimonas soli TaxID=2590999 RepID=A0A843YS57_9BURK|nr:hypothetical protein [Glaciimonas soli]MQR00554.1 hypothetical protein [Glaciimonas soli]
MSNTTGLTKDEYDALRLIAKGPARGTETVCVARNAKRLSGLKYVEFKRNGQLVLTDKGKETLFLKNCIEGLRAVSNDPLAPLAGDVATFLGRKGHIEVRAEGGFDVTPRGRESLADIDSTAS